MYLKDITFRYYWTKAPKQDPKITPDYNFQAIIIIRYKTRLEYANIRIHIYYICVLLQFETPRFCFKLKAAYFE